MFLLTLSPEFGGTSFGPFQPGPVALGSDGRRCVITLPAQYGVRPIHCYLTPVAEGLFTLQPAEQGVGLYYYARNRGQAQQVRGNVNLKPGDAFALNNPGGPRFIVGLYAPEQAAAGKKGRFGGRGVPTAQQMKDEVKRQVGVEVTTNKVGGAVQQFFYRLSSGAYFQPRYILAFAVAAFSVLATGCVGIGRLLQSLL